MFNVYPMMGDPLLKGFAVVIMGGMGSTGGVFVAGLILGIAEGLNGRFPPRRLRRHGGCFGTLIVGA